MDSWQLRFSIISTKIVVFFLHSKTNHRFFQSSSSLCPCWRPFSFDEKNPVNELEAAEECAKATTPPFPWEFCLSENFSTDHPGKSGIVLDFRYTWRPHLLKKDDCNSAGRGVKGTLHCQVHVLFSIILFVHLALTSNCNCLLRAGTRLLLLLAMITWASLFP